MRLSALYQVSQVAESAAGGESIPLVSDRSLSL
jgi:hypothetical protein